MTQVDGVPVRSWPAAPHGKFTTQSLRHFTCGQSLSLGERSVIGYPNDLTIPVGTDVGLMSAGTTRRTDLSALVAFTESDRPVEGSLWGIAILGETRLYGALLALKGLPGHASDRLRAAAAHRSRGPARARCPTRA